MSTLLQIIKNYSVKKNGRHLAIQINELRCGKDFHVLSQDFHLLE